MNITGKSIKEDLARSKAAYHKNDDLRALATLAQALKGFVSVKLPGQEKAEVETLLREAFANLGKIARVTKYAPKGVAYVKGEEPKLFQYVAALYKKVREDVERESLEEMRERKMKIDQCILKGQKLLEAGNLAEAQRSFREAVGLRVDEDGLFPMLAMKLMDKGHHKASLEYLRGALEASPENARAFDLLVTAVKKSGETQAGEKILAEVRKRQGDQPMALAAAAHLKLAAGQPGEAKTLAEQALAAQPGLDLAVKALAAVRKTAKA